MRYGYHSNPQAVCHISQRLQDLTRLDVSIAVGTSHVGGDWVNDGDTNGANCLGHLFKEVDVSLEIEGLPAGPVKFRRSQHNMNALKVCAGGHQAWNNGVLDAILCAHE